MNGWYLDNPRLFFPTDKINPFFIGFHATKEKVISNNAPYFKKHGPIGYRDQSTVRICHEYGIDAYFSGCLTLAFDENPMKDNEVYLVDVLNGFDWNPINFKPMFSAKQIHIVEHYFLKDRKNLTKRLRHTKELLKKYAKARLVITSRLHCALPCRAFGTDVVFVHKNYTTDLRFTGLKKYINGYAINKQNSSLDMSYKSVDRSVINERKRQINELFSRWMENTMKQTDLQIPN